MFHISKPQPLRMPYSCRGTSLRRIVSGRWTSSVEPPSGELSEVIGSTDRRNWTGSQAAAHPPACRGARSNTSGRRTAPIIAAYARGVNHFIETHRRALPLEFTILRYDPRPWTIVDTLCIGLQMIRDLTTTSKHEISKAAMLAGGEAKLVKQIYPARSAGRKPLPDRMHGRSQASAARPASLSSRTIRTCSTTSRRHGT